MIIERKLMIVKLIIIEKIKILRFKLNKKIIIPFNYNIIIFLKNLTLKIYLSN